ncbi:MAG: response regulator [Xenococcaceae cyanobacterium]
MASKNLHPTDLLKELSRSQADGCLQASNGSVDWLIYFHQGKLTYATHSVDPFERLERHLRRLSYEITTLTNEIFTQARLNFETESQNDSTQKSSDYQAICWLVEQQYINNIEAAKLVETLTQEVFESYLLSDGEENFIVRYDESPIFCSLDLQNLLKKCRDKLQSWQALGPQIWSPYQRPYFSVTTHMPRGISVEQGKKLGRLLRGFSFRQLAVILNQDELILAQRLYPLIKNKTIILRDPQPPFDRLPKIYNDFLEESSSATANLPTDIQKEEDMNLAGTGIPNIPGEQKNWKIVCIDDSPTMLKEIQRFLDENENFSVFTISDSLKALMKIIQIKPDLILLDVGMPNLDGYNLCSLLRKYSQFKTTPIVMVTGNKGIIDRAKAKLVGSTDYLTKPFTQSELLKIVFRYLT